METAREILMTTQKQLGLTQRELGVYAGVSTRTINSWMTGYRTCNDSTAELIGRVADMDLKALENGETTSKMRRWCLITSDGGDEFLTAHGSKADAIRDADISWNHLTDKEKAKRESFMVALVDVCLVDRTVDGCFGWSENGDVYEVAKDYLK